MSPSSPVIERYRRLLKNGSYRRAVAELGRYLKKKNPNSPTLWLEYAHLLRRLSEFDGALSAYQRAWELLGFQEDREVEVLLGLSACYRGLGQFSRAEVFLEEAERIIRSLRLESAYPFYYWNLGHLKRHRGDLLGAQRALARGLRWAQKFNDREALAYLLSARGGLLRVRGAYPQSLRSYEEAHRLFRKLRDPFGIAYTLCGIGNALRMLGRLPEARKRLLEASLLYRDQGDEGSLAYTLLSLATVEKLEGRRSSAIRIYRRALRLFERCGDRRGKAYAEIGLLELKGLEEGDSPSLREEISRLIGNLEREGLPLEASYARLLLVLLKGDRKGLRTLKGRFESLSTRWFTISLPLNIP